MSKIKPAIFLVFLSLTYFLSYPPKVFSLGLGLCHAIGGYSDHISWAYNGGAFMGWGYLEPERGYFNFSAIDKDIQVSRANGKKLWIQILTSAAGGLEVPQWAEKQGVEVIRDSAPRSQPTAACWDPEYLAFFGATLQKFAQRYDDPFFRDVIEAVNIAGCGAYGEMAIPPTDVTKVTVDNPYVKSIAKAYDKTAEEMLQKTCTCAPGYNCYCFDYYYIKSVNRMIDLYMKYFKNIPAVLQLGNGLTGQGIVNAEVIKYAQCKYGDRVWTKFNGWGPGRENPRGNPNWTRVGYEPSGIWTTSWPSEDALAASLSGCSFLCLQGVFFDRPGDFLFNEAKVKAALSNPPTPRPMTEQERITTCGENNEKLILPPNLPSPVPYDCPQKENGNLSCDPFGWINDEDLELLSEKWKRDSDFDLTGDGKINEADLSKILSFWKDVPCSKINEEQLVKFYNDSQGVPGSLTDTYERYIEFTPNQSGRLKKIRVYLNNSGSALRKFSCKISRVTTQGTEESVEKTEGGNFIGKGTTWGEFSFDYLPPRLKPLLEANQKYRLRCKGPYEGWYPLSWAEDPFGHTAEIVVNPCLN